MILPEREAETLAASILISPRGGPWRQVLADGLVSTRYLAAITYFTQA